MSRGIICRRSGIAVAACAFLSPPARCLHAACATCRVCVAASVAPQPPGMRYSIDFNGLGGIRGAPHSFSKACSMHGYDARLCIFCARAQLCKAWARPGTTKDERGALLSEPDCERLNQKLDRTLALLLAKNADATAKGQRGKRPVGHGGRAERKGGRRGAALEEGAQEGGQGEKIHRRGGRQSDEEA